MAAYAFAGLIIAALVGYAVLDHRAQTAALGRLERSGARRRSTAAAAGQERIKPRGEVAS